MQDLQSIAGGRLFGGAVERRLRPLTHHNHQSLKCPRCDSPNTKFCYYNNYNLSQPRHFCKSCRRYWTKGGVLRNVPIGGGCRKNKRSKAKMSPPEQPNATTATSEVSRAANSPPPMLPVRKSSSHSSSESSTLTAATTVPVMTMESVSEATGVASSSGGVSLNVREYELLAVPTTDPSPDGACIHALLGHGAQTVTLPGVGNFADFTSASAEPIACGLEFSGVPLSQPSHDTCQQFQWQDQGQSQTLGGLFDQAVNVDLAGMGSGPCSGVFVPLDWEVKDQGAFDIPGTADQAYWSQDQCQWTYRDQGQNPEPLPPINLSQFPF